uniref:Homoserine dehydrogenase n=1 Tax=Chaetoceros debilis TaxID=122233 RepID=A0A7S3Q5E2_9STRA|mmetsp:Transcript_7597/g.11284  ORF Transcript_7597/g.11284 Transcript_7597/m.11284 type:complete len:502 (+) Transcript_7597:285-1790(+)
MSSSTPSSPAPAQAPSQHSYSHSHSHSNHKPIHIGMFGAGTVGGGVYEIIMGRLGNHASLSLTNPSLRPCIITKICVRDVDKPRTFTIDKDITIVTTDAQCILDDEEIDIVVEVTSSGVGTVTVNANANVNVNANMRDIVLGSLKRGKSVVTANKALVAECLDEINDTVREIHQQNHQCNVRFAYEAAVCGGIPIIHSLQSCFSGDIIHEIMGICNGTTNYMLGKMEEGAEYEEVLNEAQALGYAEADPSADVEGYDVRAKIYILAKLAFGITVPDLSSIPCMGITQISNVDFEYARLLGCTIKLVGTAERLSEYGEYDGALSVYVAPKVVPTSHLLASARGAGNAVAVKSANLGISSYTGMGAGRFPTANSIVADICRIASGTGASVHPFPLTLTSTNSNSIGMDSPGPGIEIDCDYLAPFYIRVSFQDELGIIRRVGEIAERQGVGISTILQNPIKDRFMADFVVTTEECRVSQVKAMCEDIGTQDFAHCHPSITKIEG